MTDASNLEAQQQEENQDERPAWLPEKFKTAEDLARSYGELESKLGQTSQQLSEQQKAFEEYAQQQQEEAERQTQQQSQLPQAQEQLYAAYEQDPLGTLAWMSEQAAGRAVQQALQQQAPARQAQEEATAIMAGEIAQRSLRARYQDWDTYEKQAAEEIGANPDLYAPEAAWTNPGVIERSLESAYAKVKLAALTSASTEEERQAILNTNEKINAQTLSGAAGRPETPDDNEEFYARLQNAARQGYSARRGPL